MKHPRIIGWCILVAASNISCGSRQSSPICLGGSHLTKGGCKSMQVKRHALPFPAAYQTIVNQGFHGGLSHDGSESFSIDFECKIGDPVAASRDGIVVAVKEDSDRQCADVTCIKDANFVEIDHGDGTITEYVHLTRFGALVDVGESVCQGELIGLCGATGFATGPHLHFSVLDLTKRSIPVEFRELRSERNWGFVSPETRYTSRNEKTSCKETKPSSLGEDAFAHQGIVLDDTVKTVWNRDEKIKISGRYYGDATHVALHRAVTNQETISTCAKVEEGEFSIEADWREFSGQAPKTDVMLSGADKNCTGPRWSWAWNYAFYLN